MAPNDMLLTDILFFINVYAQRWPQTCLDLPTARTMLAQHLAGNLAMRDMALAQELAEALTLFEGIHGRNQWDSEDMSYQMYEAEQETAQALTHAREAGVLP